VPEVKPLAVRVDSKRLLFMPACCIHHPIGEKDLLREWVARLKSDPDARTVLLGDSIDLARGHFRNHVRGYRDDENSQEALDDYARKEVAALAKELEPIRDKVWGTIRGNHYWEFSDGTNSEQYLCQLLKIPYLGAMAMIRVAFSVRRSNPLPKTHTLTILVHHSGGSTGARTTGGDVAALARTEAGFDADMYVAGHTHRRIAWKDPQLALTSKNEPRIVERSKVFVRAGCMLKGFKEDHPTTSQRHAPAYAELRMYRPSDLGWVEVETVWRERFQGERGRAAVSYAQHTLRY
jgi:hypothetical protein